MSLRVRAGFGALYEVQTTLRAGNRITVSYAGAPGVVQVFAWAQIVTNLDFSGALSGTPWDDNPFVDDASSSGGVAAPGAFVTTPEAGAMQNAGFRGANVLWAPPGFMQWPAPLGAPSVSNGDIVAGGVRYDWKFGTQPGATTGISATMVAGASETHRSVVEVATIGTVAFGTLVGLNIDGAPGDTIDITLTQDVFAFPGRAIVIPNLFLYDPAVLTPSDATDWPALSDNAVASTNRGKGRLLSPVEMAAAEASALTFRNYFPLAA